MKKTAVEGMNVVADFTCTLGTAQNRTKKRHRVVEFTDEEGKLIRVITSLRHVTAEEVAGIYKERWAIESFFRWIKQHLNVPVLFGTTPNAVFSQLFAALIDYMLLRFLHTRINAKTDVKPLSFVGFTRQFLWHALDGKWRTYLEEILASARRIYQESIT